MSKVYYVDGSITYAASWVVEVPDGEDPASYISKASPYGVDRYHVEDWEVAEYEAANEDEG